MSGPGGVAATVAARLAAAGCVAFEDEAAELVGAAGGDAARLEDLLARRCQGEPTAWLVGSVRFCGLEVVVHEGVYVPRWQSEPLALEAVARLPETGCAVDLCTGSGALAVVLGHHRPRARVLASELDPRAVACARANRVEVYEGDLAAGLPPGLAGTVDVVTAVAPYVPTGALRLLARDVLAYEPRLALDGGDDGTAVLRGALAAGAGLLRRGGSLLVELGGDQGELLGAPLSAAGFDDVALGRDEDGEVRFLSCRYAGHPHRCAGVPLA